MYMLIYQQIISFSQEDWLWFEKRIEYPFFSSRFSEPSGCFLFSMFAGRQRASECQEPPWGKLSSHGSMVTKLTPNWRQGLFPLSLVEKFGVIFQLHRWWVCGPPPPPIKIKKAMKKSSLSIQFLQEEVHNSKLCILHYVLYISYTCLKIRDP